MSGEHSDSRFDNGSRDGEGPFWAHDIGLFDQDESMAGDKIDLATGKAINNSTHGYDNFRSINSVAAGELGFAVVDSDYDYEDSETLSYVDHWLETQNGLAKAAEAALMLNDDEIA